MNAARLRLLDDLRQVVLQLLGRQSAQAVVAAERDDQNADVAVERPVEPGQAARRRIAGHAGIDDLVVEPRARRAVPAAATDRRPPVAGRGRRSGCRRERRCAGALAAGAASPRAPVRRPVAARAADASGDPQSAAITAAATTRPSDRQRRIIFCMLRRRGGRRGPRARFIGRALVERTPAARSSAAIALVEHPSMGRRPRGGEIRSRSRERQLDRYAPGARSHSARGVSRGRAARIRSASAC